MDEKLDKERIEEFIVAIMKIARGDYSIQLELSEENNYLDALAIGINMMADDIKKSHEIKLENDRINQLNDQLMEANKKAQESDRLKTVFLQNMSHEIRTPLNAIIGFADILPNKFNNKEKLTQYTSIIKQRGLDLLGLIEEILDLSRIETGKVPVNNEECNLTELFNDLQLFFMNLREKTCKTQIEIQSNTFPCNGNITITTDAGKLKQIFINLLNNALKFTNDGIIKFGCTLNDKDEIIFFVSDTGIGIPNDKQSFIFDRFTQINDNSAKDQKGTGLGLSIVKGLIGILGGNITLKSVYGKGSTFYFTVPYEIKN